MKKVIALVGLVGLFLFVSGVVAMAMTLIVRGLETADSLLFGLGICVAGALLVGMSVFFIPEQR